jgi:hypothetical protein
MAIVIAIVKRDKIEETVESLNNLSPTIRFTIEREVERKLPFLDLMLEVNGGKIEFDIYQRPQFVQRFIPNTSHHPVQHKMAAFETMIFRMFNTPLSAEKFAKEKKFIEETAVINGYKREMIRKLMKKHETRKVTQEMTTLEAEKKDSVKTVRTFNGKERRIFVNLPFFPPVTDKIQKILKKHNINSYYTSNGNLKDIIGKTKDKESRYRGQTCRRCVDRYAEHERAFRKKQPGKSAIADHCLEEDHEMGPMKLLQEVRENNQLDAWKSLLIFRGKNLVNVDEAPITSPLFSHTNQ